MALAGLDAPRAVQSHPVCTVDESKLEDNSGWLLKLEERPGEELSDLAEGGRGWQAEGHDERALVVKASSPLFAGEQWASGDDVVARRRRPPAHVPSACACHLSSFATHP